MESKKPTQRRALNSRDKILDATLALMKEVGPDLVTLDAVALRAKVSKGGLLHHFRYKDQLLLAANERLVQRRIETRHRELEKLPPGPSRVLKAYVLASVKNPDGNDQISTRLIGIGSSVPGEAKAPIRQDFIDRFPPFVEAVGSERAALVLAATEGLWFMDVLGLSPFTKKQRSELIETILEIADGRPFTPAGDIDAAAPKSPPRKRAAAPLSASVRNKKTVSEPG